RSFQPMPLLQVVDELPFAGEFFAFGAKLLCRPRLPVSFSLHAGEIGGELRLAFSECRLIREPLRRVCAKPRLLGGNPPRFLGKLPFGFAQFPLLLLRGCTLLPTRSLPVLEELPFSIQFFTLGAKLFRGLQLAVSFSLYAAQFGGELRFPFVDGQLVGEPLRGF